MSDCILNKQNYYYYTTAHCQWEDKTVRERTGDPPSYAKAKKIKLLKIHTVASVYGRVQKEYAYLCQELWMQLIANDNHTETLGHLLRNVLDICNGRFWHLLWTLWTCVMDVLYICYGRRNPAHGCLTCSLWDYCIVFLYRYLYSTSHSIHQIEVLSVHFSSR